MNNRWLPVITGIFLAIAITTAMDATGYSVFSALPLFPLFLLFWWWQKFPKADIGFKWGSAKYHAYAVAYPLLVMSALIVFAALAGAIDISGTNWNKAMINLFVGGAMTILMTIITEEGFFRGWLWAGLKGNGQSDRNTLIITSLVFMAWHISAVSLETGFDLPAKQIPIYLVNASLIGLSWGMMRLLSGSIIVSSVSHGIWNGLAYSMFGFGEKTGALGIQETWLYGPEVGVLGVLLNVLVVIGLWRMCSKKSAGKWSVA